MALNQYKTLRHLGAGGKALGIDFFDYIIFLFLGILVLRIAKMSFDMVTGGYMLIGGWALVFILMLVDRKVSKRLPRGWMLHWMTYNQQIHPHNAFNLEPMPEEIGEVLHKSRGGRP